MITVNVHQVKAKLSYYLNLVLNGKKVIIAKRNIPIAEIIPFETYKGQRIIGQSQEKVTIPQDFFKPLPKSIRDAFNNPK